MTLFMELAFRQLNRLRCPCIAAHYLNCLLTFAGAATVLERGVEATRRLRQSQQGRASIPRAH